MVKALILAARALARKQLFELAGAASIVYGLAQWEPAAGWVAAGVALLGKALEADIGQGQGDKS